MNDAVSDTTAPLDGVDVLLSDLDGVVYIGAAPVPHAAESLRRTAVDRRVGFLTNNASRTAAQVAAQLSAFGLAVTESDVVTSPQVALRLLAARIAPPARVLVLGGDGLASVLATAGYRIVSRADEAPAAVVQGFSPDTGWRQLAEASFVLSGPDSGATPWIATNGDLTLPVAGGLAPGNGALVAALQAATGRTPLYAGKPEPAIFAEAVDRFAARHPLVVGDRLDTDVRGARRAGIAAALVLTGVHGLADLVGAPEPDRPDFILSDLRELHEPYPAIIHTGDTTHVRDTAVTVMHGELVIDQRGDPAPDLVRAVTAAAWRARLDVTSLPNTL